ncbi:heme-binding protein [uncultured Cohaesibacter sp.]|uniref:GlcG/HbpS family heme-binding protein n=1 Tax=uncultured Cohaesibacter sp. TaxID=1002546 RepID=UPI0029C8C6AB|nr:heme-binding protein [uncultured Cohaesibacter sp.]
MKTLSEKILSIESADALIQSADHSATTKQLKLCFAVCDAAGHLRAFRRMDSAGPISINVAIGKARTAALFGKPTQFLEKMIDSGKASMTTVPDMVPIAGGVPVLDSDFCVGALGVSGASSEVDNQVAMMAINTFVGKRS